jgi:hypothetical protein
LVNTVDGPYLVAGDTLALYENWEGRAHFKHIPSGIHYNLAEYYETFTKMEKMNAQMLPGHDPRVLERAIYP